MWDSATRARFFTSAHPVDRILMKRELTRSHLRLQDTDYATWLRQARA